MKLIAAHVFEARGIGRAAEESGEVLDPLHVVMLGLRRELADRHVFNHALPQRAYGLIGHRGCSCLDGGCRNPISRQDAPWRYPICRAASRSELPRERFSPLTRSGHSSRGSGPFVAILESSKWLVYSFWVKARTRRSQSCGRFGSRRLARLKFSR